MPYARSKKKLTYQAFFASAFAAVFFTRAGLDFPKDPLKIFPRFVFLSPLPMMYNLVIEQYEREDKKIKKQEAQSLLAFLKCKG
jgi:hypothetical protein